MSRNECLSRRLGSRSTRTGPVRHAEKTSLALSLSAFLGTGAFITLAATVLFPRSIDGTDGGCGSAHGGVHPCAGNLSSGVREDRTNRWVLSVFGAIGFLIGWFPAYTGRLGWSTIDGDSVRWLGVALYRAGGVLRLWPVFVLGDRFSGLARVQPGHSRVTGGIYRWVRHPSYLGMLICVVGWALTFRSIAGLGLAAATLVPVVGRIRRRKPAHRRIRRRLPDLSFEHGTSISRHLLNKAAARNCDLPSRSCHRAPLCLVYRLRVRPRSRDQPFWRTP